jgi:hypothetical protein
MKLLFDDQLWPITGEYGFVEASLDKVAMWFERWDSGIQSQHGVQVEARRINANLMFALRALEPLTSVLRSRFLFVATASNWTAYFDNGWRGADAASLSYVAEALHCRAVRVVAVPDSMGSSPTRDKVGRFGATIFELYGANPTAWLNHERTICAMNDGGKWIFDQQGEPLPFERPEQYRARGVRDRFTFDLLDEYLRAIGIRAFDETAFSDEAVMIERLGVQAPGMRQYTLAETRLTAGLS